MVYRVSGITSVMIMISISTSFARECKCSWREVEGRRTFQQQLLNIPQICGRNQANGSKGASELVSLHLANSERTRPICYDPKTSKYKVMTFFLTVNSSGRVSFRCAT